MNLSSNQTKSLTDLIFENRNKRYGAYELRTSYESTIIKSLLGLLTIITTLSIGFYLNSKNSVPENFILVPDIPLKELIYETVYEFKPLQNEVQKNVTQASAAPSSGLSTRIIDEPIVTSTVNLSVTNPGIGPVDSKGVSLTSSVVTTNTTDVAVANTKNTTDVIHVFVQEMPEFEGGDVGLMKFISQNIVYPSLAKDLNIQGTVYVSFVVNEVGNVEQIKIIKGVGFGCDEEVARVMNKIPTWKKVGKNDGKPVKVRFNVPVSFKLK